MHHDEFGEQMYLCKCKCIFLDKLNSVEHTGLSSGIACSYGSQFQQRCIFFLKYSPSFLTNIQQTPLQQHTLHLEEDSTGAVFHHTDS